MDSDRMSTSSPVHLQLLQFYYPDYSGESDSQPPSVQRLEALQLQRRDSESEEEARMVSDMLAEELKHSSEPCERGARSSFCGEICPISKSATWWATISALVAGVGAGVAWDSADRNQYTSGDFIGGSVVAASCSIATLVQTVRFARSNVSIYPGRLLNFVAKTVCYSTSVATAGALGFGVILLSRMASQYCSGEQ